MCPESAVTNETGRIETDECSPEKFGRIAPNRWPSSVVEFQQGIREYCFNEYHPGSTSAWFSWSCCRP
ncbi:hypothetical protein CEXT_503231 [Caerostris extrusa]|uniref:Uncharacterized protein n=1 Tax=Caerostris extrusa TaxID=172846 RepID=A0AAV4P182_CAEEX|nr:hypothetical protein CEXT_503231 [Caerostris extrusa]